MANGRRAMCGRTPCDLGWTVADPIRFSMPMPNFEWVKWQRNDRNSSIRGGGGHYLPRKEQAKQRNVRLEA